MEKNIIVSGASRGIGRAIALKFAEQGFAVAVTARNKVQLEDLGEEVNKVAPGLPHLFVSCDMSDKEQVMAFAEGVLKQWHGVEILVNNAGTFLPGQILDEPEDTLEKLIKTNLFSAYHLSRAVIPGMVRLRHGHVFNMCSVASLFAYPNGGSYSISKFALLGLSKTLREELKPYHIKVTSLMPGATLTDSWAGVQLSESRFMKPEDIAQLIFDIYHLSPNTVIEEVLLRPVLGDI